MRGSSTSTCGRTDDGRPTAERARARRIVRAAARPQAVAGGECRHLCRTPRRDRDDGRRANPCRSAAAPRGRPGCPLGHDRRGRGTRLPVAANPRRSRPPIGRLCHPCHAGTAIRSTRRCHAAAKDRGSAKAMSFDHEPAAAALSRPPRQYSDGCGAGGFTPRRTPGRQSTRRC